MSDEHPVPDTIRDARSPAEWTIPDLKRAEAPAWVYAVWAALVVLSVPSVVLFAVLGRGVNWIAIAVNAAVVLVTLLWVVITERSARARRLETWLAEIGRTDPEGWREADAFDEQRRQTAAEQRLLGR
jgi:fatty acid desaturase